ncbi:mitochondrial F1F0 ATP synthase-like protein subunit Atp14 [Corynespora cassiicola Philippines]|uniref:Mitochondrial F1F0 ATP synthase-like protein subunit Atp14 n=1 Tax=Corynespora cassiicola Philippines TaxID=1448308 RepID=A0A2T2NMZ8_CORCC|nr:mitochondrial F1F0 ATP synthase-like protein subunit Atp14 [Corynespora cassiicola Philippines]
MLAQSIRASRQTLARVARQQTGYVARRTFIVPTAVRQADLVQDLYLRELKAYKPAAVKPTDAEGHVQKFAIPKAPASPEEADIANELKAYETQQVDIEGAVSSEDGAAPVEEDWFEEEEEETAAAH